MENRHLCSNCEDPQIPICYDEAKVEELKCSHCDSFPSSLFQGKPICQHCKSYFSQSSGSRPGSIRSDRLNPKSKQSSDTESLLSYSALNKSVSSKSEREHISTEYMRANQFFQRYMQRKDLVSLYDSRTHGLSSRAFHANCDDSKGGLILLIVLKIGYSLAAFTWKGIRRNSKECFDIQAGGAIFKENKVEFISFSDQLVVNEKEGIRFSTNNDLYINFDHIEKSECKFDKKIANKRGWTSLIQCILAYEMCEP